MASFSREFGQQTQVRDIRRQRPRPAKTYLAGPGASRDLGPDSRWGEGGRDRSDSGLARTGPTAVKVQAGLTRFAFLSIGRKNVYISD